MSEGVRIKVFDYHPQLECLTFTPGFEQMSLDLGLCEWHPGVWLGRLFCMDNDFGEHWFDNWDERERLAKKKEELGIEGPDYDDMMIVLPRRFQDGRDGPCHEADFRRLFWLDVLRHLTLDFELVADEARRVNDRELSLRTGDHVRKLSSKIESWRERLAGGGH